MFFSVDESQWHTHRIYFLHSHPSYVACVGLKKGYNLAFHMELHSCIQQIKVATKQEQIASILFP